MMKLLNTLMIFVALACLMFPNVASADKKITDMTENSAPATGDWIPHVDISDTTEAASGTTKKATLANLLGGNLNTIRALSDPGQDKFLMYDSGVGFAFYTPTAYRLLLFGASGVHTEVEFGSAGGVLKSAGSSALAAFSQTLEIDSIISPEVDGHASGSLSAAQVSGTVIYNTGQGASDVTLTLPTAAAGYSFVCVVGTTVAANKWRIRADTNDKIYRYGTDGSVNAGADNGYVGYSGAGAYPTIGHSFACFTFKTTAYDWICKPCTSMELTAE